VFKSQYLKKKKKVEDSLEADVAGITQLLHCCVALDKSLYLSGPSAACKKKQSFLSGWTMKNQLTYPPSLQPDQTKPIAAEWWRDNKSHPCPQAAPGGQGSGLVLCPPPLTTPPPFPTRGA
jgi:hypothetical protein